MNLLAYAFSLKQQFLLLEVQLLILMLLLLLLGFGFNALFPVNHIIKIITITILFIVVILLDVICDVIQYTAIPQILQIIRKRRDGT